MNEIFTGFHGIVLQVVEQSNTLILFDLQRQRHYCDTQHVLKARRCHAICHAVACTQLQATSENSRQVCAHVFFDFGLAAAAAGSERSLA